MNQAVADIIKGHIEDLDFVDKIAGLTSVLTFEMRDKDNNTVQKSFPIACCVTADDCKEGAYNELMPNSEYKTVIYFEDGGVTFERYESNWKYFKSSLRLVCWINIEKLIDEGVCKSEVPCTMSAHIIADIIRALPRFPEHHAPFDHVYSEITNQIVRSPSIFSAYTYDEKHSQYLMAPYDYFALDIQTSFAVCLESTAVYDASCCDHTDWFLPSLDELTQMYTNLAASDLGEFADANYWSSSEQSANNAYAVPMNTGGSGFTAKNTLYHVRACRTFVTIAGAYAIGDTGPCGGLIFYIDEDTTYYEAAPTDKSASQAWSNIVDVLVGTDTAIGTGQANTTAIIAQAGHADSAAKLCDDLNI